MRVTEAQLHVLHLLMLDDDQTDPSWATFSPPLNALAVQKCADKGLIEISNRGLRLTNAGRAAYIDHG